MKQTKQLQLPMGGLISLVSILVILFLNLNVFSQIPPPPDDSIYFEASISFENSPLADGYAYKLFSCDNNTGQLQNPIIIVEGIDPGDTRW